jgi:hypothetical protein
MYPFETPQWLTQRPVGLIQSENLIRSMCLLLQTRALQKGASAMFESDKPNWDEASGGIAPVDLYRILLADSGVNRAVVLGFEDQQLMKYRTKKMGWAFRELEEHYPS